MTKYQTEIQEKRRFLRQEYGGLMSLKDLARELGLKDTRAAKRWATENELRSIPVPKKGGDGVKFDTDHLAKILMAKMFPAGVYL